MKIPSTYELMPEAEKMLVCLSVVCVCVCESERKRKR